MEIVYISNVVSKKYFNELFEISTTKPGQQVQKFHRLIFEGLVGNGVTLNAISSPPTINPSSKNTMKSFSELENLIHYHHLTIVFIPIIKNLVTIIESFKKSYKLFKANQKSVLVCDVISLSATIGALAAAKMLKIKTVGVVTDFPEFLGNKNSIKTMINNYIMSRFDSYIFLTEAMNEKMNIKNKPHLVIEGLVDIKMKNFDNRLENKENKFTLMYAGGIERQYGIEYMVKGFVAAALENSELIIYGNGGYVDELREIANQSLNVVYHGVVKNDEILDKELKVQILVNPRYSSGEYTKYSFPSKNLEYMVSGTPILTTKLPGMPKEYLQHVYLIENETEDGFANTIKSLCNKSREDLHSKGILAKEFVMENKNNVVQAKRIIEFLGSHFG